MSKKQQSHSFAETQMIPCMQCVLDCSFLCYSGVLKFCNLRSKRFRRVWEQRKTEERGFRYFACAENGVRDKKGTVRVGEGKEGNACGQTSGF